MRQRVEKEEEEEKEGQRRYINWKNTETTAKPEAKQKRFYKHTHTQPKEWNKK